MSFIFKVQANTNGYFLWTSGMGGALAMDFETEDHELELGLHGEDMRCWAKDFWGVVNQIL